MTIGTANLITIRKHPTSVGQPHSSYGDYIRFRKQGQAIPSRQWRAHRWTGRFGHPIAILQSHVCVRLVLTNNVDKVANNISIPLLRVAGGCVRGHCYRVTHRAGGRFNEPIAEDGLTQRSHMAGQCHGQLLTFAGGFFDYACGKPGTELGLDVSGSIPRNAVGHVTFFKVSNELGLLRLGVLDVGV